MNGDFEIGRFYVVPTVRGRIHTMDHDWPVLGPKHEDTEIIHFSHHHYHIDWRFVSQSDFERLCQRRAGHYGTVLHEGGTNPDGLPPAEMRRRKCLRTFESVGSYPRAPWLLELEAKYAKSRITNLICPHRGISLEGCARDGDVVTCPGHGLRWNVKTFELMRSAGDRG